MRRPVRTITLPSTPSRRIRFGEPTSSLPSGVIVAALSPNPASRIARAASWTISLPVERRFSSERSNVSSSSSTSNTSPSSTRIDCSSSSWPVSSPSSTTIFSDIRRPRSRRARGPPARGAPGALGRGPEGGDHERDVLVEVDAEPFGALAHRGAVDGRGERGRLHLLLDRLRRQPVDALRPHVGARHHEARQLVDGEQRLLHHRVARDLQVVRGRGDGADHVVGEPEPLELRERVAGMAGVKIRIALVVEVVQHPDEAPALLVLAELARVRAHARLHGRHMASQALRRCPLAEELPRLVTRHGQGHRFVSLAAALMEKFVIEGGAPLSGTVAPAGNKNAALPLIAAALLTPEPVILHNVPRIRDTEALIELLADLGVSV